MIMSIISKGIIFDLDGLLIDSEDLQIEAEKLALKNYGVIPSETDIEAGIGWTITRWAKYYKKKYKLSVSATQLFKDREKFFLKKASKALKAMPGADKILDLSRALGFRMALASSNYRKHIEFVLKNFNWNGYFEVVLGEEDVKEGKPSPDLFLKTAKILKLKPENCVVFEDSYNGMLAAKAAKMKCVIVGKEAKGKRFKQADRQLKSLKEINEDFLNKL